MNPFNLRLAWRGLSSLVTHGYHPKQDNAIYEYWQAGPVELQSFFRKSEPAKHIELDLVRSNNKKTCGWCGVEITEDNDSGWEVFTAGGFTQPQCKTCEKAELPLEIEKDGGGR